ncbi:MAG: FadR/GntR family transcriptional regulator [Micropruina sp.]|nr:FadR family transcriptional regulator [Micropruina sp.]
MRTSRADDVVEYILASIESGAFEIGGKLPGEGELAGLADASRLTVREGVKTLAAQRVLTAVQGRGTFVNAVDKWLSVDAVMRMQQANPVDILLQLFDVRSFIEVGAAERFAPVVTDDQLAQLERQLDDMRRAHAATDVPTMTEADLAFHQTILDGCQNPFIAATMQPLSRALSEARRETSKLFQMREHAIEEHTKILRALRERDPVKARRAMRSHMRQTRSDTRLFFDRPAGSATA